MGAPHGKLRGLTPKRPSHLPTHKPKQRRCKIIREKWMSCASADVMLVNNNVRKQYYDNRTEQRWINRLPIRVENGLGEDGEGGPGGGEQKKNTPNTSRNCCHGKEHHTTIIPLLLHTEDNEGDKPRVNLPPTPCPHVVAHEPRLVGVVAHARRRPCFLLLRQLHHPSRFRTLGAFELVFWNLGCSRLRNAGPGVAVIIFRSPMRQLEPEKHSLRFTLVRVVSQSDIFMF